MTTKPTGARYHLGPVDQIPVGEGRTFPIGEDEIAVFRTREGTVFAVQARCPHRGGPLADGLVAGGRVTCPLHGMSFDLASGRAEREGCAHLRSHPVTLTEEGDMFVPLDFR